jgi:hypothetical protein
MNKNIVSHPRLPKGTRILCQQAKASPSSSREGEGKKSCHSERSEGTHLSAVLLNLILGLPNNQNW